MDSCAELPRRHPVLSHHRKTPRVPRGTGQRCVERHWVSEPQCHGHWPSSQQKETDSPLGPPSWAVLSSWRAVSHICGLPVSRPLCRLPRGFSGRMWHGRNALLRRALHADINDFSGRGSAVVEYAGRRRWRRAGWDTARDGTGKMCCMTSVCCCTEKMWASRKYTLSTSLDMTRLSQRRRS